MRQQKAERRPVKVIVEEHIHDRCLVSGPEFYPRSVGVGDGDELCQAPAGRAAAPPFGRPSGLVPVLNATAGVIVLPVLHERGVHADVGRVVGDVKVSISAPIGAVTVLHDPTICQSCASGYRRKSIAPADDQHGVVGTLPWRCRVGNCVGTVVIVKALTPVHIHRGIDRAIIVDVSLQYPRVGYCVVRDDAPIQEGFLIGTGGVAGNNVGGRVRVARFQHCAFLGE